MLSSQGKFLRGHTKGSAAHARRVPVVRSHGKKHEDSLHEVPLGHNVISKVSGLKDMSYQAATVIKNEAASLDGNVRLLTLSVSDNVEMLYGRKTNKVGGEKLTDSYSMPGQFVALKMKDGALCSHLFSLASSPYESHRDSYGLDASMIQVSVDALHGNADDKAIATMGPGSELEVSPVIGRGFASLLGSASSIPSAIEAGSPLLAIAWGSRGLISIRPLLNWTPVLAHAGSGKKVAAVYLTKNSQSAGFLSGWDLWREAGIDFNPIYSEIYDPELTSNKDEALYLLDKTLFLRPGGFSGLCGGPPSSCTVLIAGASGELASVLVKKLNSAGVSSDSILFCDFF